MAPQSPILEGDVLTSCHRARLLPGLDNLSYSLSSNHRAGQNGVYSSPALEPQSSLPFCGIRNEVPTPFCGLALSFVSWYRRACSYSSGPRRYRVPASEPCLNISSLFIFQTTELKKSTLLCMPEVDTDIQKHTRAPNPNQGSARMPGWSHLKFSVLICSLFLKSVSKNLTSFSFETRL